MPPSAQAHSSKLTLILSVLILGLLILAARLFLFSTPTTVPPGPSQSSVARAPIDTPSRPIEPYSSAASLTQKNNETTYAPESPAPPTATADSDTQAADRLAPLFAHIEQTDSLADLNTYLYSPNAELREAAKSFLETATFLELPDYHEPPPEKPSASTP